MQEPTSKSRRRESGGVLIEFSLSVMVLWLIVAATLDLGRAFAASHILQSAARTAARELALREDLAWNASFDEAIRDIFDPSYLVVDATCLEREAQNSNRTPGEQLDAYLSAEGFLLNQMLRPLMIFEEVVVGGQPRRLLRYPGALLTVNGAERPSPSRPCVTPYTVGIPEIDERQGVVVFHGVVEELEDDAFPVNGATSGGVLSGTVTIRLHYPFQAVGLTAWRIVDGVNRAIPITETDRYRVDSLQDLGASTIQTLDSIGPDGEPQAYAVNGAGSAIPVYGGRLGLGVQGVLGQNVRPFRRVITAQAAAPREVFAASGGGSS